MGEQGVGGVLAAAQEAAAPVGGLVVGYGHGALEAHGTLLGHGVAGRQDAGRLDRADLGGHVVGRNVSGVARAVAGHGPRALGEAGDLGKPQAQLRKGVGAADFSPVPHVVVGRVVEEEEKPRHVRQGDQAVFAPHGAADGLGAHHEDVVALRVDALDADVVVVKRAGRYIRVKFHPRHPQQRFARLALGARLFQRPADGGNHARAGGGRGEFLRPEGCASRKPNRQSHRPASCRARVLSDCICTPGHWSTHHELYRRAPGVPGIPRARRPGPAGRANTGRNTLRGRRARVKHSEPSRPPGAARCQWDERRRAITPQREASFSRALTR